MSEVEQRAQRVEIGSPPKTKVPFSTRVVSDRLIQTYARGRDRIVGMNQAHSNLDAMAYGLGTILTFEVVEAVTGYEPGEITIGNDTIPADIEHTYRRTTPYVGVVAPRRLRNVVVGYNALNLEKLAKQTPRLLVPPSLGNDTSVAYIGTGIIHEVSFEDIRIAREVPHGGPLTLGGRT